MSGRLFSSVFASTPSTLKQVNVDPRFIILETDYTITSATPIGEGGCSSVFKGRYNNKTVAVKRFKIDNVTLPVNTNMLLKEAEELQGLNHSNVIKFIAVCPSTGCLLLEYAVKTISISEDDSMKVHSLRQLLDGVGNSFPEPLKFEACYQILRGLQYIHSKKVIHGDLKSANVLVTGMQDGQEETDQFIFKLTDLGQAHVRLNTKLKTNRTLKTEHVNKAGTVSFEAPEIFENSPKNEASDVYSYGMLMYELLYPSISHPWESICTSSNPQVVAASIIQAVKNGKRPPVDDSSGNCFTEKMMECWNKDPQKRPSVSSLLIHIQNLQVKIILIVILQM
jgi:serine/threonine protein kinase